MITRAQDNSRNLSAVGKPADEVSALVSRVQHGDIAAFDSIMLLYRERLYSVIYNMTFNHEYAADLTQESFVKAFWSLKKFKGKSSFFTWLYRIGVNLTLSHLQRKKTRKFFSFEQISEEYGSSKEFEKLSSSDSSSVRKTLLNELHQKLNEALLQLSDKHRTIVVLFEIDGLSHKEISKIMKCTEGTVRSRLHYAKLQLQSLLTDYLK